MSVQIPDLDEALKTISFLVWFLLLHLLKQSLRALGPVISSADTQKICDLYRGVELNQIILLQEVMYT